MKEKKTIYSAEAPEPIGPYSQAIRVGDLLFLSGQVGFDRSAGKLVTGDIKAETRQVMKNMGAVLKAAGYEFANVVKCTIFLKSMDDFADMNAVYGEYFPEAPPARETVQVSRLPLDANVEISCIVVRES